jgi:hypothetical protein
MSPSCQHTNDPHRLPRFLSDGLTGRQRWNLSNLVFIQLLPEDAWWPMRLGAPDGLIIRGDNEIDPEVVDGLR